LLRVKQIAEQEMKQPKPAPSPNKP
jgi:hypothetical protein